MTTVTPTRPVSQVAAVPDAVRAECVLLSFTAGGQVTQALSGIDLTVPQGSFTSLIGPSGCGKTTLLRAIADLEQPTAGRLTVAGMTAQQARLSRAYGYVFQAPALFPWRNVERNVRLPLELTGMARSE
jgi:NitT/TauT family transport system ATP-binding protein